MEAKPAYWQVSAGLSEAFDAGSEDAKLKTLALCFSWGIVPFSANIFRQFLMQKDLKLVPFGSGLQTCKGGCPKEEEGGL